MAVNTQVNYVCWKSDIVSSTIPTEAATPSDQVLLATHAPLQIKRQEASGDRAAQYVSEQQVLDEFLTATPNNGVLVASVLGESGAGKSHLVRWVHANIARGDGRHVVYLQKTQTSLKDVVEALLVGQADPEFEELRRKVSLLGSGMTLEEMEHKLLAELAEALRTAEATSPRGKALVGPNGLRLLFTDRLFEEHLLRDGSFIRRRAQHALRGRDADEGDVPLEFTADELPTDIGDYRNVAEAGAATQRLFRRLVSDQAMQVEAVRLINENLDVAVMKAASLAVGDIGQAFKRIREKLAGQEIILLIEDVALIQGVRRDLLDAIIEVGVVQGEERYATVRTLMAVTPGYYSQSLPETFRRRSEATSPTYAVDVDLDGTSEDDLVDFVGRYLNAARVGKEALESEAPRVRNACDSCKFQSSCHATFGTSSDGYGLYPYNRPALMRAIRACGEVDPGREHAYFNPRKVLSRAVRNVLNENIETISGGTFPPSNLLAAESTRMGLTRLAVDVREQIEHNYEPEAAGRLETLVTFWGATGTEPLSADLLEAFSHPPVPADLYHGTGGRFEPPDSNDKPEVSTSDLPRSVERDLDSIDSWSEGSVLPQGVASELRKVFRDALLTRVSWLEPTIKEPDVATVKKAIPENALSVSIEGANENIARAGAEPLLRLDRSARMAVTFKGLVLLKAGYATRAGGALSRVDGIVAPAVPEAKSRIVAELLATDADLVGAASSLIRGAAVCGVLPDRPSDLDCVNACLWQDVGTRPDAGSRLPEWIAAYGDYLASRKPVVDRLLASLGAAQGTGTVHAIDFTRFAAVVTRARGAALGDGSLDVPQWARDTNAKLGALVRLTPRQLAHWEDLVSRVRAHMPKGSLAETLDAIVSAVRDGQPQGLVRVRNLQELEDRNTAARALAGTSVADVERALKAARSVEGTNRHRRVGAVVGGDLQALADYFDYTDGWVTAGIEQAQSGGEETANVDELLDETLREWKLAIRQDEERD